MYTDRVEAVGLYIANYRPRSNLPLVLSGDVSSLPPPSTSDDGPSLQPPPSSHGGPSLPPPPASDESGVPAGATEAAEREVVEEGGTERRGVEGEEGAVREVGESEAEQKEEEMRGADGKVEGEGVAEPSVPSEPGGWLKQGGLYVARA